ncbi:hypothetical protein C8J57DRAFT_1250024 [Mycena rebaudengoi]|nr:hypothetical protein C8J57DRAFT_1250024 [Mycena rebaudengoi]
MSEILEAGYFFPLFIWLFISLILMITGPEGLHVLVLWCDLSDQESKIFAQHKATLLYHAQTFDPRCIQHGGSLGCWVNDLQDLANAIPDTHGLMIFTGWNCLPLLTLYQIDTSDSDSEDMDTAAVLVEDESTEPIQDLEDLGADAVHGEGIDFSRYFWPQYALPSISNVFSSGADVIYDAGLYLTDLLYDARKTIMNLGVVFIEFEPLLHTSPQIYTCKQWLGIMQVVPRTLHWRKPEEEEKVYESQSVPATWLKHLFNKGCKQLTLLDHAWETTFSRLRQIWGK